jgi:hypothetical protein
MRVQLPAVLRKRKMSPPGWRLLGVPLAAVAVVAGVMSASAPAQAAHQASRQATKHQNLTDSLIPNKINNLDCNGWSTKYESITGRGALCTDPVERLGAGDNRRFIDNHWYVGHDEPSVRFISNAAGSGNTMTYYMQVPKDPKSKPTSSGSVTDYGELSPAPWFGVAMCDPRSYPQKPCTPDSDKNLALPNDASDAGSALMELQFYPPGFGTFVDGPSCSATQWCAAVTIDSLMCNFGFKSCNPACEEPVNFAYLQTNGVPSGPPSPQKEDLASLLGNAQTLKINQGDIIKVAITDPKAGFTAKVTDETTHQTGYMTASAANGFANTNMANCDGTPFTWHAEFSTARYSNRGVPWAALEGTVLMEQEIGHFETCSYLTSKEGYTLGTQFSDPDVYQTCNGGEEGTGNHGGSCSAKSFICIGAEAQGTKGPVACPTNNAASGQLCEFSDGYCMPAGNRTVTENGKTATVSWPVTGCQADQFENGDLDFDGTDYHTASWPNGTSNTPTPTRVLGPFDAAGKQFPQVQFLTDVGGSSRLCDTNTGSGCTAPPAGAQFYPYWTLSRPTGGLTTHAPGCIWNFGTTISGLTRQSFGGDKQYGKSDLSWYGGTLASAVLTNPESTCASS